MMTKTKQQTVFLLCLVSGWFMIQHEASAQLLRIRDICRVKGQDEKTLHGVGLVVGLAGTGDSEPATVRKLARYLDLLGASVNQGIDGLPDLTELENVKNVASVFVTATVPAQGAREGDVLDVSVSAFTAKSLAGGRLMLTTLVGPVPRDLTIYGLAHGQIALDDSGPLTAGKVTKGCRVQSDVNNSFVGKRKAMRGNTVVEEQIITLVVDKNHASFQTAFDIAEVLNSPENSVFGAPSNGLRTDRNTFESRTGIRARALDQVNIEVLVPDMYATNPVDYIAEVLQTQFIPPRNEARVVIDERNGSIVIGNNVMVGRVAVASRQNLSIETAPEGPLFEIDQTSDTSTTRLKALVAALNRLKVGPDEIIQIIKNLDASGELYGRLIIK